jgi:hypothetical protein
MQNQQPELAKKAVKGLIDLSIHRCKQGIGDIDPDFSTNFGFIDQKAVQIDIGRFYLDSSRKIPSEYMNELTRITTHLRRWLAIHHPPLVDYFDQQLQLVHEN